MDLMDNQTMLLSNCWICIILQSNCHSFPISCVPSPRPRKDTMMAINDIKNYKYVIWQGRNVSSRICNKMGCQRAYLDMILLTDARTILGEEPEFPPFRLFISQQWWALQGNQRMSDMSSKEDQGIFMILFSEWTTKASLTNALDPIDNVPGYQTERAFIQVNPEKKKMMALFLKIHLSSRPAIVDIL